MQEKGICQNCQYDTNCSYDRKFPVYSCDEYKDVGCQAQEQE